MKRAPLQRGPGPQRRTKLKRGTTRLRRKKKPLSVRRPEVWAIVLNRCGGVCEIASPVCIAGPVHPHHMYGQSPNCPETPETIFGACNPCNGHIENYPDWAEAAGFKRKTHGKPFLRPLQKGQP